VNRKLIFLNVVLLALAGWLFWMLRLKWIELHQHEHTVLALSPAVRQRLMPPSPMPLFKPMSATDYNDVAQKMLFSKDRNPNVIVDPPPPPPPAPPPPPMPDLPAYYGTMALFGDPVILLKLPKGQQRKYHAGEMVGPFKLVSFDKQKVVFEWDDKIVERKPEELKEKESAMAMVQQNTQDVSPTRVEPTILIKPTAPDAPKISDKIGADNGAGIHQCVAGDTTPAGTVVDGYKKVVTFGMFGETCMWQQISQ
jgi:hypothetical protein